MTDFDTSRENVCRDRLTLQFKPEPDHLGFRWWKKLRRIVFFRQHMEREGTLRTVPNSKTHSPAGSRNGTWSLLAAKNWHIRFRTDQDKIGITDI